MKLFSFIRAVIAAILFPIIIMVLGSIIIVGHYLFQSRTFGDRITSLWGRLCCQLSGVKVITHGLENRPDGGCLYLFNHSSFFDIFALVSALPGVRFGAKAELFKIPIFAQAMKVMNNLPIARDNRDEVYKIYEESKARFAQGEQFALSPEGGRFYSDQLSPFKAGPFIFAISAGAPVVPVVVLGAYQALPKGSFLFNKDKWYHEIHIKILPAISTVGYSLDNRKELQLKVYEKMNSIWKTEEQFVVTSFLKPSSPEKTKDFPT